MDYVYICKYGENEELRYSIRSVEANLPPGKIWVVGGKPSWYSGNYIPVEQSAGKQHSAIKNLSAIVQSDQIQEDFVLMNDDFFVVKPVKEIKTYHGGSLKDKIDLRREITPGSRYLDLLLKTYKVLQKIGIAEILDYEIHVPMKISKTGLREALGFGTQWRSTYGNTHRVGGEKIEDVKVYGSIDLSDLSYSIDNLVSEYLSTDDQSFPIVWKKLLKDMFPDPSTCEM
jgi:hypothetical protein